MSIEFKAEEVHPSILESLVKCLGCKEPIFFIYDEALRDTCDDCGGMPKWEAEDE
jgi:hypothetical protein